MKERPILFSGPMVLAIRGGLKTMTRRVVKWPTWVEDIDDAAMKLQEHGTIALMEDGLPRKTFGCPYGVPGDRLWVRETFALVETTRGPAVYYRAGGGRLIDWCDGPVGLLGECANEGFEGPWTPSIFMRRWQSRLTLEVTSVGVELVQDISEEAAKREGVSELAHGFGLVGQAMRFPRASTVFRMLWDSINAARGYGWDANPWVWVVGFRILEGGAS